VKHDAEDDGDQSLVFGIRQFAEVIINNAEVIINKPYRLI
jgi:hypothetical protein